MGFEKFDTILGVAPLVQKIAGDWRRAWWRPLDRCLRVQKNC